MSRNIKRELFSAVRSGNLEDTRNLIDSFGLAYIKAWSNGYVLLRYAIKKHRTEIAKLLLTKGAKVNSLKYQTDTPLHFASINGNIEIIEMLLDRNANINAFNKNGDTPLHYAILYRRMEVCELLLNRNADINAANKNGNTPLHYAIKNEQMIMIDLLLNRGASVNARDNHGRTPLHVAIFDFRDYRPANTNTKLIELLLSKGADINDNAEFNLTPLHVAIEKRDETIVKLLLEHGANVDAQDKNGQTILNLAVEKGDRCIVEHILKFSPDVNDESNRKCLHAAIYGSGNNEILYKLLEYGFGVESEDINNCKLLFCAVERGYLVIVDILFKNGADVNMLYKFVGIVYTLLHCATDFNQAKIVELLLSYGADVNAKDEKGETPIDYAARDNNSIIGKLLLTNKANVKNSSNALSIAIKRTNVSFVEMLLNVSQIDIDAAIENGKTALHFTAECYTIDTALLLLNRGANVNATDESGHTALHYAICKNNEELVQILLEYNADVNCQVEGGATPLHFAAERGNEEICEMLLNKGANVNQENNGRTALHIAVEKRRLYIVKMLLQHGAEIKRDMMSIHIAAEQGFACIIENLLIKFGVDVDCRDEHNRTALHIASEQDEYRVVGLLLKYGADINAMDEWKKTPLDYATCILNDDFFASMCKWRSSLINILEEAILMRNAANLYVSEKNFQEVDINRLNDFYCECVKEVENLRREKICKYVSFYDIVTKGASQLAIYARNKNIVKVLNFVNYRKKFPMYADMIGNNFKIGQMRQCLLHFAAKSLDLLTRYQLPDHVTAQMCSYFSKEDLENLIDACPDNVAFRKTIAMDRLKIYSGNDREANLKKCFYWLFREKLPALLIEQIFGYLSYNDIINLLEACPSYDTL